MIKQTLITLVATTTALHGAATFADSFSEDESRSYTQVTNKNLVGACVSAIEDYYDSDAGLTLKRRGSLSKGGDVRSYRIDGWIWRNGSRAQITHNCVANADGKGLFIDISYPSATKIAGREANENDQS